MGIAELRQLPSVDKLKIIEILWSDVAGDEGAVSSPAWHETELENTERGFVAGQVTAMDWDDAKNDLLDRKK